MRRDFIEVINRVIEHIPEQETELRARVHTIRDGAHYKAPEAVWRLSGNAFMQAMADRFSDVERQEDLPDWAQRMGEIFRGDTGT